MQTTLPRVHSSPRSAVTRTPGASVAAGSPWNQQVYGRLRQTLQGAAGRRSRLFAVCDDLRERDRLVQRLDRDCGALGMALFPGPFGAGAARSRDSAPIAAPSVAAPSVVQLDPYGLGPAPVTAALEGAVTRAIAPEGDTTATVTLLQLCGIEQFTRLSARHQQALLRQLDDGADRIAIAPVAWVIWLPRPWLDAIRQSAPRLWALQTAPVFEFEGEPTPTPRPPLTNEKTMARTDAWRSPLRLDGFGLQPPTVSTVTDVFPRAQRPAIAATVHWRPGWRAWMRSLQGSPDPKGADFDIQELERACELGCQLLDRADLTPADRGELLADLSRCFSLQLAHLGNPAPAHDGDRQRWQRLCERAIEATQRAIALLPERLSADVPSPVPAIAWVTEPDSDADLDDIDMDDRPPVAAIAFDLYRRLGHLLTERVRQGGNGAAGWQAVVDAYGRAIAIATAEGPPPDLDALIATYNNLGTAHWNLAPHDRTPQPLQGAIAAYRAALTYYNPPENTLTPDERYGLLQTNLGTAYLHLAKRENHGPWLDLAIEAFRAALPHRPAATDPAAHGATQANLGTAHWRRYRQMAPTAAAQPPADLLHAIAAYEATLQIPVQNDQANPPHRRDAARHLGLAYYHLATVFGPWLDRDRRRTALDRAFHAYRQSLDLPPQAHPHRDLLISALLRTLHAIARQDGPDAQRAALNQLPGPWIAPILEQLKPL
jgi:tetratricopeptide (TPR) repeat protein